MTVGIARRLSLGTRGASATKRPFLSSPLPGCLRLPPSPLAATPSPDRASREDAGRVRHDTARDGGRARDRSESPGGAPPFRA